MTSRRIAVLLLSSALGLAPVSARAAADPAPKRTVTPGAPRAGKPHAKAPVPPPGRAAAAPSTRSPILGTGGEDAAASLERRRKAFFAKQPDGNGPDEPSPPAAGVTLGGSGGISPGMGFKF